VDCLVGYGVGLGRFATILSYFFKYDWPECVSTKSSAFGSAARTIVSSSKSVNERTSVSTSREEAHTTLQGEAFAFPLEPVGNSSPLLAFHEVRMNQHDLSLRSRNMYETFLLLVM